MIVRILGEGQLTVDDSQLEHLNKLDAEVEAAVAADDETTFATALDALLHHVRDCGAPLADESLEDSDLILPPADATIDEVRKMLNDDGLIPG